MVTPNPTKARVKINDYTYSTETGAVDCSDPIVDKDFGVPGFPGVPILLLATWSLKPSANEETDSSRQG